MQHFAGSCLNHTNVPLTKTTHFLLDIDVSSMQIDNLQHLLQAS